VSGKVAFTSYPPLNPPASGGRFFLHLHTIYLVYALAKGRGNILPPRLRGGLGWGFLVCDTFSDTLVNPLPFIRVYEIEKMLLCNDLYAVLCHFNGFFFN
jgi:hypothetical protein